uniref:Kinesin-like protein n=1 Tax=Kalanchoe fedtschenkoi TaxID=63787 RepID=A0A7N1A2T1_KALFE
MLWMTQSFYLMFQKGLSHSDTIEDVTMNEKGGNAKENNVAKIKVVVRKRPLNKKELSRKEDDIVTVNDGAYLTVHEPKLKVDLTAYVEKHEFCFDAVLDECVSNDEVYRATVEPIIPTIFQRTKATCFAYGQTGSGKTFTMQPLPLRAVDDIVRLLHHPAYRNEGYKLWLSYFEIYGGKLYDLLSDRKKLLMREDGRQQVCIVGLKEFEVSDVQIVKQYIETGNSARSTGSTGANEESSRSHAILQLAVKKHVEVKGSRRNAAEVNESKVGKVVGKISFIDLAGSERGADTTDNDKQTRIEGAEINKSLLALKECIRALDNDQIHIPFRGSKLTEVLRDSFVGNSRTVMISCISPNAGSCEHTLNTLRYADRVKSLSKSGNTRKDQFTNPLPTTNTETVSASSLPMSVNPADAYDHIQEMKVADLSRKVIEKESASFNPAADLNRPLPKFSYQYVNQLREQVVAAPVATDNSDLTEDENTFDAASHRNTSHYSKNSKETDVEEQKVSPPRRKGIIKDVKKPENVGSRLRKELHESNTISTGYKSQNVRSPGSNTLNDDGESGSLQDATLDALLEEEEALIAAHRKEIENTMEIVREEMKLLGEVEQPGSQIDDYVTQLSLILSRKAAGLVSLQARLARFQHRLKEQEILSRKRVPR